MLRCGVLLGRPSGAFERLPLLTRHRVAGQRNRVEAHEKRRALGDSLFLKQVVRCYHSALFGTLALTLARMATRVSFGPYEIDEYASMVVLHVGQFVGEIGEVIADTNLQVLSDAMVDCGQ